MSGADMKRIKNNGIAIYFFCCVGLISWCFLTGCSTRLIGELEEEEANKIISVLEEDGIEATKSKETKGRQTYWSVEVPSSRASIARKVLIESGLPGEKKKGISRVLETGSIIPTISEEKTRKSAAIGEELAKTIESLPGVIEAWVFLAMPDEPPLPVVEEKKTPEPSASVLVRHRGKPNFSIEDIQKLVAGAVSGLKPENVAVIFNSTRAPHSASNLPVYGKVGPFFVAPSSRAPLFGVIIALVFCNILLAGFLVFAVVKVYSNRKKNE